MKHHKAFYILPLLLVFFACQPNSNNRVSAAGEAEKALPSVAQTANLIGSYVGSFGDNKITVLITKATKNSVEGRSVVGGFDRPFSGTVQQTGAIYKIVAKEPGDDKHDGTFDFSIDLKKPDVVKGSWNPYKPTDKIKGKEYTLERRSFVYNPEAGSYAMASQKLLTDDDINNMSKDELEFMRNEIFARHGYCFQKKALRQQFENEDWYVPNTANITNLLTAVEKKNIALIKKYEKYAEEYGDEFGR